MFVILTSLDVTFSIR